MGKSADLWGSFPPTSGGVLTTSRERGPLSMLLLLGCWNLTEQRASIMSSDEPRALQGRLLLGQKLWTL